MYVDDHVNAYLLAMTHENARGQVLNVATGVGHSNVDVTTMIAEMIGYEKSKIHINKYPPGYPYRPISSDQPYLVLDSSKIKTRLGANEPLSLEEGLKRTIEFWQSKR